MRIRNVIRVLLVVVFSVGAGLSGPVWTASWAASGVFAISPTSGINGMAMTATMTTPCPPHAPDVSQAIEVQSPQGNQHTYTRPDGTWDPFTFSLYSYFSNQLPIGTYSMTASCYLQSTFETTMTYEPVSFTITGPAPAIQVSPKTVPFGGHISVYSTVPCPPGTVNMSLAVIGVEQQNGFVGGSYIYLNADLSWQAPDVPLDPTLIGVGDYVVQVACQDSNGVYRQKAENAVLKVTPPPSSYVALGDSFSSGEGAGQYTSATNTAGPPPNRCHRSTIAWPALVGQASAAVGAPIFRACSGAITKDYYSRNSANTSEGPQRLALGVNTSRATITLGGNDAHFGDVMNYCATRQYGLQASCQKTWGSAVDSAIANLGSSTPTSRDDLLNIYRDMRKRSPNAQVLAVGYPRFFPASPPASCSTGVAATTFQRSDMLWINGEIKKLNSLIANRATAAGLVYVDVYQVLSGHELCTAAPWLNKVVLTGKQQSFHPNAAGQRAIAAVVGNYFR